MPNIRPICDELSKVAKEELNEVTEEISDQLTSLREWISLQPHLVAEFDDQFLVTFLRGCKYDMERTKSKISYNFTVITKIADLLTDRDPTDPDILQLIRLGLYTVMPFTDTPDGPTIILARPRVYKPGQFEMSKIIKLYTMIASLLQRDNDNFNISGQLVFYDLTNVGWSHLLEFDVSYIKKVVAIIQEAMPTRLKGIHILRPPTCFETFVNIIRAFLSAKNKKRLMAHGNKIDSLYKIIPQRCLPTEYGGEAGPIQNIIDDWEKKLIANKEYFRELDKYGTPDIKVPKVVEVSKKRKPKLEVD